MRKVNLMGEKPAKDLLNLEPLRSLTVDFDDTGLPFDINQIVNKNSQDHQTQARIIQQFKTACLDFKVSPILYH